jgi:hypothetical protein
MILIHARAFQRYNAIMKLRFLLIFLFSFVFPAIACNIQPGDDETAAPTIQPVADETEDLETIVSTQEETEPFLEPTDSAVISDTVCQDGDRNPIGESIAQDYDFATYEQVMVWFCDGAEFEDILLALETEADTGALADESLQMLAAGFSWEEIWLVVGLNE